MRCLLDTALLEMWDKSETKWFGVQTRIQQIPTKRCCRNQNSFGGTKSKTKIKVTAKQSTIRFCYKPGSSCSLHFLHWVLSCCLVHRTLVQKMPKNIKTGRYTREGYRRIVCQLNECQSISIYGLPIRFPGLLQAVGDGKLSASSAGVIPPQPARTVGCEVPFNRLHHNTLRTL